MYSIQEIERVRNDQWSKGTADILPPHSLPPFPPVLSYLTRTLLLRKIGQGIRKMYLAPMRGFFYACMRVTGRWVICDRSRIQGLQRFWRCIALSPAAPVTSHERKHPWVYCEKRGFLMPNDFDLIIIGAGPAGIFTALELADTGMSILILEKGLDIRERIALNKNRQAKATDRYANIVSAIRITRSIYLRLSSTAASRLLREC